MHFTIATSIIIVSLFISTNTMCYEAKRQRQPGDALAKAMHSDPGTIISVAHKTFNKKSRDVISSLKQHENDGVAVHAAWEEAKLSIMKSTKSDKPQQINSGDIQRFLGFLEGRLKTNLPPHWNKLCEEMYVTNFRFLVIPDVLKDGTRLYSNNTRGYRAPINLKIIRKGMALNVKTDDDKFTIPAEIVKKGFANLASPSITASLNEKHCFVAFHSFYNESFELFCIDRKSNNLKWRTKIHSNPWERPTTYGPTGHYVYIKSVKNSVIIYGASLSGLYIEAFHEKNGNLLWRFSTMNTSMGPE